MDFEKFYGKLWKHEPSIVVTIPENLVRGADLKEGTEVIVMIKKKVE